MVFCDLCKSVPDAGGRGGATPATPLTEIPVVGYSLVLRVRRDYWGTDSYERAMFDADRSSLCATTAARCGLYVQRLLG